MRQGRRLRTIIALLQLYNRAGTALFSIGNMKKLPLLPRFIVLLALLLWLAGCSAVRVVYNQADHVLAWTADDYFNLDVAQKQAFNAKLAPLLAWHRQDQLPGYVKILGEAQRRTQRREPLTRDDALWMVETIKAQYRTIAGKATPEIADLLAAMTPENLKALERQFAKVNQKFVNEHKLKGSPDEQRRERLARTVKRIREWTGPLTAAQLEKIGTLNDAIPNTDALRHQDRQRRQKEFLALLNQRHNKAEFTRALGVWLADWENNRPSELKAALNDSYEKRITLYLEVLQLLNAEQRGHVQAKLQGYIDDVKALTPATAARH